MNESPVLASAGWQLNFAFWVGSDLSAFGQF